MAITAEIIEIQETPDILKNIIIWVCFKDGDGIEIPFDQGGQPVIIQGKNCWPLYGRYENFLGKTDAQILEWIRVNVEHQIGNIIQAIAKPVINQSLIGTILPKLVSTKFSKESVTLDLDGIIVTIKPDGTVT